MSEFVVFLVELALLALAAGVAVAVGSHAGGRLAAGTYTLVTGCGLVVVPLLAWEVARTDNAFLGLYLIGILAVLLGIGLAVAALVRLRSEGQFGQRAGAAAGAGLVAAVVALAWLAVRGPGAWATGTGQFGLDVIVVAIVLGLAAYLAGRRLSERGRGSEAGASG